MQMRFFHDPDGQPHIWSHGVLEQEAWEAFNRRTEDRPGKRHSRVAIGHTRGGRILRLVYAPDPGGKSAFLITAFDLRGKPLIAYRRRQRGRHRGRP